MAEVGIALQQIQQTVQQVHQPVAELLVGPVPLAVPVRVRNEDEAMLHALSEAAPSGHHPSPHFSAALYSGRGASRGGVAGPFQAR